MISNFNIACISYQRVKGTKVIFDPTQLYVENARGAYKVHTMCVHTQDWNNPTYWQATIRELYGNCDVIYPIS